ncbi:hypothetical protein Cgig2_007830 [Carnegiea gigantea]|uniref:RecQ-mediated genome instability protein 2 n=1 Tax=Carnegiea gigantea TaxID=171969 RepID=A0A9Q1GRH8_9CARY|nr:hypothetical protein Cgig2_007830 [Carnegiea gigantea]
MDYSLAALKLMCGQLKQAKQTPSPSSFTLGGILFQRAWLQGVLVSISDDRSCFILDDGSGVIELLIAADFLTQDHWQLGMYVMVVGAYFIRDDGTPMIKVHKIVDLSAHPDREAMWYLEVIEAYRIGVTVYRMFNLVDFLEEKLSKLRKPTRADRSQRVEKEEELRGDRPLLLHFNQPAQTVHAPGRNFNGHFDSRKPEFWSQKKVILNDEVVNGNKL